MDWNKFDLKETAAFICSYLNKNGIDAILVGGSCASIYTKNKYMSYDLDYVTYSSIQDLKRVLVSIGFEPQGRIFKNPDCKFYLDFPNSPVSIGKEAPIERFKLIKVKNHVLKLLRPEDILKDRLAAFFYWNDRQSMEQAVLIAKSKKVNMKEIKKWVLNEGELKKFEEFLEQLKKLKTLKKV